MYIFNLDVEFKVQFYSITFSIWSNNKLLENIILCESSILKILALFYSKQNIKEIIKQHFKSKKYEG